MGQLFNTKTKQLLLLVSVVMPMSGVCMSFFNDVKNSVSKGGDVVTFSKVEGVVTFQGKPVINAKIIRRVEDKDGKNEDDFASTDEKGYFSMPSRYGSSDGVMQEVYAWQYIFVEFNGEKKEIWYHVKHVKEEHGELDGVPIYLQCELTAEELVYRNNYGGRIISICLLKDFKGNPLQENLSDE